MTMQSTLRAVACRFFVIPLTLVWVLASGANQDSPNSPHVWSGVIQPASGLFAQGASEASGVSSTSSTASSTSSASAVSTTSQPEDQHVASAKRPANASHVSVTSLQQLLALKNRVLMELQRHRAGSSVQPAEGAIGADAASTVKDEGMRAFIARTVEFVGSAWRDTRVRAGVVLAVGGVLLLIVIGGVFAKKRRRKRSLAGPVQHGAQTSAAEEASPDVPLPFSSPVSLEAQFLAALSEAPNSKQALMGLADYYAEQRDVGHFDEIAQRIWQLSKGRGPNWQHVAALGRQLNPAHPLYADVSDASQAGGIRTPNFVRDGLPVLEASALAHPSEQAVALAPSETSSAISDKPADAIHEPALLAAFPADALAALEQIDMPLPPRQGNPLELQHAALCEVITGQRDEFSATHVFTAEAVEDAVEAKGAGSAPLPAGFGAAYFEKLNLSFDLASPAGTDQALSLPSFSPKELEKIARNKLELALEYLELGDCAGAQMLANEVMEMDEAQTREGARALLAKLAALS